MCQQDDKYFYRKWGFVSIKIHMFPNISIFGVKYITAIASVLSFFFYVGFICLFFALIQHWKYPTSTTYNHTSYPVLKWPVYLSVSILDSKHRGSTEQGMCRTCHKKNNYQVVRNIASCFTTSYQFEILHGRSIYTTQIGTWYKSELLLPPQSKFSTFSSIPVVRDLICLTPHGILSCACFIVGAQ